jgi:hypothetical protein
MFRPAQLLVKSQIKILYCHTERASSPFFKVENKLFYEHS